MARHVKGVLFLDYVRMIRKRKNIDWSKHLEPEDFQYLEGMILPSGWYPLETYRRMGSAVLHEIAKGDVEAVRRWGRQSLEEMLKVYKTLVVEGDPIRTMEKFQITRSRFFDFEGLQIEKRPGRRVQVKVDIAFQGGAEEEAYAYQTLGALERLLELSGAKNISHKFHKKGWEGDEETILDISWE